MLEEKGVDSTSLSDMCFRIAKYERIQFMLVEKGVDST